MRKHKELMNDPYAYVESLGRHDKQHIREALANDGKDTIVRLCFSTPEENPPLRLLGYFAAAYYITRQYFPKAQLQLVATVHSNARINGQPLEQAIRNAKKIFEKIAHMPELLSESPSDIIYALDKPNVPDIAVGSITSIMHNTPEAAILEKSAKRRGTKYQPYVAAHLFLHDCVDSITSISTPVTSAKPRAEASSIISIGSQSERPFYTARMKCRQSSYFTLPGMVEKTGQIFTRHVLPPYTSRHKGAENRSMDPRLFNITTPRAQGCAAISAMQYKLDSVTRDLIYTQNFFTPASYNNYSSGEVSIV